MRYLIFFSLLFVVSICEAGFKTDSLNVTGSSLTINGLSYQWPSTNGSNGQCLITDGGNPPTLSWATCGSSPSPTAFNFLLLEDNASFFLLEDNASKLELEQ